MADVGDAIASSLDLVLLGATTTCLALFVIAAIDIPYQRFEFIKKLKSIIMKIYKKMQNSAFNQSQAEFKTDELSSSIKIGSMQNANNKLRLSSNYAF